MVSLLYKFGELGKSRLLSRLEAKKMTGILLSHNQFVFLCEESTNWKWETRILVAAICEQRNERRAVEDSTAGTGRHPVRTGCCTGC